MNVIFVAVSLPLISAAVCPVAWTLWEEFCYRQFNDKKNRVHYDQAQARCNSLGSELARTTSRAELEWLSLFAHIPGKYSWEYMPLIGFKKPSYETTWDSVYNNNFPAYIQWTRYKPIYPRLHHCTMLYDGDYYGPNELFNWTKPSMESWSCNENYSRFICKKPMYKYEQ